jgi:hypothetical protein
LIPFLKSSFRSKAEDLVQRLTAAVQDAITAIQNEEKSLDSEQQNNEELKKSSFSLATHEKELWNEWERKKFHLIMLAQLLGRVCTWVLRLGVIENELFMLKISTEELAMTPGSDDQKMICFANLKSFCQSLQAFFNCDPGFQQLHDQNNVDLEKLIDDADRALSFYGSLSCLEHLQF